MTASAAANSLEQLELFLGAATPQAARVYARLPRETAADGDWRLAGTIRGPRSMYAHTLPVTSNFRPLPADRGALLAEAVVVDPCFWTPESPNLYDCRLELQHDGRGIASVERTLGLRRLAVRGPDFLLEGKRWVLRGATRSSAPDEPLAAWRETDTAIVADYVDDALAAEASRVGVLLVADLSARHEMFELARELQRLARWPAVGFALLPPLELSSIAFPPNLLVGQVAPNCRASAIRQWAQFLASSPPPGAAVAKWLADLGECGQSRLPVIARRLTQQRTSVALARRECDRLQADLAVAGGMAGYMV